MLRLQRCLFVVVLMMLFSCIVIGRLLWLVKVRFRMQLFYMLVICMMVVMMSMGVDIGSMSCMKMCQKLLLFMCVVLNSLFGRFVQQLWNSSVMMGMVNIRCMMMMLGRLLQMLMVVFSLMSGQIIIWMGMKVFSISMLNSYLLFLGFYYDSVQLLMVLSGMGSMIEGMVMVIEFQKLLWMFLQFIFVQVLFQVVCQVLKFGVDGSVKRWLRWILFMFLNEVVSIMQSGSRKKVVVNSKKVQMLRCV